VEKGRILIAFQADIIYGTDVNKEGAPPVHGCLCKPKACPNIGPRITRNVVRLLLTAYRRVELTCYYTEKVLGQDGALKDLR
jgi:hypothetical protein